MTIWIFRSFYSLKMTNFAVIASGAWQSMNLNTNSALWVATLCFRKAHNDKTLVILSFRKKAKYDRIEQYDK